MISVVSHFHLLKHFQNGIIDKSIDCVKSVRIRSFSGPYFPAFGLNTERLSLRIHSEYGKMPTKKTPNTDTFHAVIDYRKTSYMFTQLYPILYG